MGVQDDLTPAQAAAELSRTSARVQRRAHWPAWLFLGVAAVNFAFFVVVGSGSRTVGNALIPVPILILAITFVIASRQPVIGRDAQRINRPIVLAAVATTVAGLMIDQTVLPRHFTGWLALLAALMVTPYVVGSWRWLRR